jgi:signal transduction histidine kinase
VGQGPVTMNEAATDSYLRLPRRRYFTALEWHAAAIGTIAAAVLVVGYGFNFAPVQTIVPGFPTMKARTAAMLMALSLSYLLSLRPSERAKWMSTGLAAAVAGFAIVIAVTRPAVVPENPWEITPSNATIFGLFAGAVALLAINHQKRGKLAIAVLALVAATPALFRILALILFQGAPDENSPLNTMALHTAVLIVWFLLVCVILHPKLGVADVILRASLRGRLLRSAMIVVVGLPIAAAALSLFLSEMLDGAEETLFALDATIIVTMGALLLWWLSSIAEGWQGEANEHAARLSRANEALEQYASSAAHDLKAPARHVLLYGEMLEDALARGDVATARRHAKAIRDSALELPELIDGILDSSRQSRTRISLADNSLSEMVQAGAAQHAAQLTAANAVVRVLSEARLRCDSALMTTVFQNLIANAIKSRRRDRQLEIRIDCRREAERWVVSVEDNGVGFDPDFAAVAFNPLARGIHTAGDGDGIGLATCRNIIQSHGGEISIDPAHRQGARIVFTLPANVKT